MSKIHTILKLLILLSIISCASMPGMPGSISESKSEFDGSRQISMEPAWLYNSSIKLALFKNTKMGKNDIILTAVVKGAYNFSDGESLHFNIDGDIVSFRSIDSLTSIDTSSGHVGNIYIPPSNWSSKDYVVNNDLIKRLINAERAVVKIDLRKSYVEGIFSSDAPTTARPAFRTFYQKMETSN